MSLPSAILPTRAFWSLIWASLLTAAAAAQSTNTCNTSGIQVPSLTSTIEAGEILGREQVLRQRIRCGTNEFAFVVPGTLRAEISPDGGIVLGSADLTYYVTIRRVGIELDKAGLEAALQEQITGQYADAINPEGFTTIVAGRVGTGVLLRQEVPKVGLRFVRVLWVPFKAGVLEFALNSDARCTADSQSAFDMILLTFRSNEQGKVEIIKRSDKS